MSFDDCLRNGVMAQEISPEEAETLRRRFGSFKEALASEGEDAASAHAKDMLRDWLKDEAARKKKLAARSAEVTDRLSAIAENYRTPLTDRPDVKAAFMGVLENRNDVLAGAPSVVGRRDALTGYWHGRLEQLLYDARRSWGLGRRMGRARLESMVDAAYGATADPTAVGFVSSYRKLADELVDRANALGMDIPKLENYFPQPQADARLLASLGETGWKDLIRPLLDAQKMRDPRDGLGLSPARLDEALSVVYRRKVTDGMIDREPGEAHGMGALANRRADHRFLIFKDAASWKQYNAAVHGDIFDALRGHLDGLAKDIASLDILGPNPQAMVTWMGQVIDQEAARKALGQVSLYNGKPALAASGRVSSGADGLMRLWHVVNGSVGTGNQNAADLMQALRNVLMGDQLASTFLTALAGDPFQANNAARFAGVPAFRWLAEVPKQLFSGASRREVTRAGVVLDDAMEHLRGNVKGLGWLAASNEATKWLPDRVLQWTLLTPFTKAERRAAAANFMFAAADRAGQSLADMAQDGTRGRRFAQFLEGFGIDGPAWDRIRAVDTLDHGPAGKMLRPMDVFEAAGDDQGLFDLGLRYSEAVHAFREESTPTGTARIRAAMGRDTKPGTFAGEALRSMTMYQSFAANVAVSLANATAHELADGNHWRGAGFFIKSFVALTLGGAMMAQLSELRRGRDPRDASDPKFWLEAMGKGAGVGFLTDWITGDYKRGSLDALNRTPGPLLGLVGDLGSILDVRGTISGDEPNRTQRALRVAQNYIPGQNMWQVKLATQRLLWDRLQLATDPDAYRKFQRAEKKLRDDEGQGMWWRAGDAGPKRAPDLSTAWQR